MQINIKVSYKSISTLWASKFPTICYNLYWWEWSSVLKVLKVTSFHYLYNISKEEVGDGVHFLRADKHQSFYKKWPDFKYSWCSIIFCIFYSLYYCLSFIIFYIKYIPLSSSYSYLFLWLDFSVLIIQFFSQFFHFSILFLPFCFIATVVFILLCWLVSILVKLFNSFLFYICSLVYFSSFYLFVNLFPIIYLYLFFLLSNHYFLLAIVKKASFSRKRNV